MNTTPRRSAAGLRQFLNPEQQRNWIEGKSNLRDADERSESMELRFKYVSRFQKLLGRPQAQEVLKLLRLYGQNCIPIPRKSEGHYWSISCLPSTSDKPLVRVNASWISFHNLCGWRGHPCKIPCASFGFHHGPFTQSGHLDEPFLEHCVTTPEDVGYFFPRGEDIFGMNVRGAASIRDSSQPARVARHSQIQSDAHEPGSERLSGEPLLQLGDYFWKVEWLWDAHRLGEFAEVGWDSNICVEAVPRPQTTVEPAKVAILGREPITANG